MTQGLQLNKVVRQPEEEQDPTAPSLSQHARALGRIIRRETEMMDRRQPQHPRVDSPSAGRVFGGDLDVAS